MPTENNVIALPRQPEPGPGQQLCIRCYPADARPDPRHDCPICGGAGVIPTLDDVQADLHIAHPTDVDPEPLPIRTVQWSRVRPVQWLWDRRIPMGRLSLIVAEEGGGKGTIEAYLIKRVVRGELDQAEPMNVLIVGDEDGFDDTWIPRIYAHDLTREEIEEHIFTLDQPEGLTLEQHMGRLAATIRAHNIGWVIFDQLIDHIDGGKDGAGIYNAKHIRDALRPLGRLARDTGVAVTGNLHPVKGAPKTFRDLLNGSQQFNAVSRSSLWLGYDPEADDNESRVIVRGKGNNSEEPPSFDFRIVSRTVELEGQTFTLPVVADPHEGVRYRRDFEGDAGRGWGQKRSAKSDEIVAKVIEPLLTDEPQRTVELVQASEIERTKVTRALQWLEKNHRAEQVSPRGPWRKPQRPNTPDLA